MIAFVLTLLYTALTLLSPGILPDEIVRLHVAEILGGLTIVATAFSLSGVGLAAIPETYLALALIVATALSTMATGWLGGVSGTVLGFLPIILNFFFILVSCRSLKRLKVMTFVLLLVALYIIAQGVVAAQTGYLTSPYLETEGVGGEVLYRHRGLGVLNDPNDLAQFLVMLLPLLWLRWKKGSSFGNVVFTLLPAGILLSGIYLTHSRGGILAVIAVLLFGFRDKLGLIWSSVLAGLATVVALVLNVSGGRGISEDDGGRVALWVTGLEILKTHPIFGIGVGRFSEYSDTGLTAHNSYVLCLAELGLPGYFFWLGLIVSCWTGLTLVSARKKGGLEETEDLEPARVPALEPPAAWRTATPWGVPEVEAEVPQEEEFTQAAKVMQVSMVGLLTASFFLSRTYSMTLYVLLGMAVALRSFSLPPVRHALGLLFRRISLVMAGSIVFLYVFVRVKGVR